MNYYDETKKRIHIECPACGKAFQRSVLWLAKHQGNWTCPYCHSVFEINNEQAAETLAADTSVPPAPAEFHSKIAGVSHQNADGAARQQIIKRCQMGERLTLACDPQNPVDPNAVMVLRQNGEQLGYLNARLAADLHSEISAGKIIPCCISDLTGLDRPTRGVNIYIGAWDAPPEESHAEPVAIRTIDLFPRKTPMPQDTSASISPELRTDETTVSFFGWFLAFLVVAAAVAVYVALTRSTSP